MCHYESEKRCIDFSLKMHQKHLAAGLCPDPLRELNSKLGKGRESDRREGTGNKWVKGKRREGRQGRKERREGRGMSPPR